MAAECVHVLTALTRKRSVHDPGERIVWADLSLYRLRRSNGGQQKVRYEKAVQLMVLIFEHLNAGAKHRRFSEESSPLRRSTKFGRRLLPTDSDDDPIPIIIMIREKFSQSECASDSPSKKINRKMVSRAAIPISTMPSVRRLKQLEPLADSGPAAKCFVLLFVSLFVSSDFERLLLGFLDSLVFDLIDSECCEPDRLEADWLD